MSAYSTVHSYLVRTTPAYLDLLDTLEAAVGALELPPGLRVAVPSSTGEFVEPLLHPGDEWRLLDFSQDVLDLATERLGPDVETGVIDLTTSTSIGVEGAALVLCVHALHIFSRDRQDVVLRQLAHALAPGGRLVLVGFCRSEWLPQTLWRVAKAEGGVAALRLAPWRLADALSALLYGFGDRRSPAGLKAAMEAAGLVVSEPESVFLGCSILLIGRKP